jgi:HNH endonuclease
VNLVMPAAAWLGLTDSPGEIVGTGPADAATCRDLAGALAARGDSRWCLTVTDPNGRTVAHGCAGAGPGPPATSDRAAWLRQITIIPIETGTCSHTRESAAYRPPDSLRHLIKIRDRRCGYPGCRRPATRCDDDHTIPYQQGGRTCECNLYPLCRRHHRAKQAPGWHLSQSEPGQLTWTTPSGRRYAVTAEEYAA